MTSFLQQISYAGWALHFLIWFPVVGMLATFLGTEAGAKKTALTVAVIEFLVSIPLWPAFNAAASGFQLFSSLPSRVASIPTTGNQMRKWSAQPA